ncbi:Variant-silencing SET domain-containing protein [Babesia sp. Xinjiang]|uniref:Variant-silencing SET domain-containing protein n=1 Tax=Babesia sp. Xinjiang TaxID=462227 RepID=UPI000A23967F|nr:Variant-silencing SET domain-containing protein [Babesia sp. Xinjiang]ORM39972.1 Variant-silencing SET domain-containing protein [Babesia sp. Xinjiang]
MAKVRNKKFKGVVESLKHALTEAVPPEFLPYKEDVISYLKRHGAHVNPREPWITRLIANPNGACKADRNGIIVHDSHSVGTDSTSKNSSQQNPSEVKSQDYYVKSQDTTASHEIQDGFAVPTNLVLSSESAVIVSQTSIDSNVDEATTARSSEYGSTQQDIYTSSSSNHDVEIPTVPGHVEISNVISLDVTPDESPFKTPIFDNNNDVNHQNGIVVPRYESGRPSRRAASLYRLQRTYSSSSCNTEDASQSVDLCDSVSGYEGKKQGRGYTRRVVDKKLVWPLNCWICREPMDRVNSYIICSSVCKRAFHASCESMLALKLRLQLKPIDEDKPLEDPLRLRNTRPARGSSSVSVAGGNDTSSQEFCATVNDSTDHDNSELVISDFAYKDQLDNLLDTSPTDSNFHSGLDDDPVTPASSVNDFVSLEPQVKGRSAVGRLRGSRTIKIPDDIPKERKEDDNGYEWRDLVASSSGWTRLAPNCISRDCVFCLNSYTGCSGCFKFVPQGTLVKCAMDGCSTFYCYPDCLKHIRLILPDKRVFLLHRLVYGNFRKLLDSNRRPLFICHSHTCWSCYDCDRYSYLWETIWRVESTRSPIDFMSYAWQELRKSCRGKVETSHFAKGKRIPRPPTYPDVRAFRSFMQSRRFGLHGVMTASALATLYPHSDDEERPKFHKVTTNILLRCVRCERTWCTNCVHPDVHVVPQSGKQVICHDCIHLERASGEVPKFGSHRKLMNRSQREIMEPGVKLTSRQPKEIYNKVMAHLTEQEMYHGKVATKPTFLDPGMLYCHIDTEVVTVRAPRKIRRDAGRPRGRDPSDLMDNDDLRDLVDDNVISSLENVKIEGDCEDAEYSPGDICPPPAPPPPPHIDIPGLLGDIKIENAIGDMPSDLKYEADVSDCILGTTQETVTATQDSTVVVCAPSKSISASSDFDVHSSIDHASQILNDDGMDSLREIDEPVIDNLVPVKAEGEEDARPPARKPGRPPKNRTVTVTENGIDASAVTKIVIKSTRPVGRPKSRKNGDIVKPARGSKSTKTLPSDFAEEDIRNLRRRERRAAKRAAQRQSEYGIRRTELRAQLRTYLNRVRSREFNTVVRDCDPETILRICSEFRYMTNNVISDDSLRSVVNEGPLSRCSCRFACGSECSNAVSFVECNSSNCNFGDINCGNRRFKNLNIPKLRLRSVDGKGLGAFASENIEKDELVCEYVGKVISQTEFQRCVDSWSFAELDNSNSGHWYIMKIQKDVYIDSTNMGNVARFINHSCDPNCVSVPYNVNGTLRMGVFAQRRIASGEEVTYNYGFSSRGVGGGFKCLCGAKNCRGMVGVQQDTTAETLEEIECAKSEGKEYETLSQLMFDMASIYTTNKEGNYMKPRPSPLDVLNGIWTSGDLYRYDRSQTRLRLGAECDLGDGLRLPMSPVASLVADNTHMNQSLWNYSKLLVLGGRTMKQWDTANTKEFAAGIPWGIIALENNDVSLLRSLESGCLFPDLYAKAKRFIQTVCMAQSRHCAGSEGCENLQRLMDLTWGATEPCYVCSGYGDCKNCDYCGDVLHDDNACGDFYVDQYGMNLCNVCQNSDHRLEWLMASNHMRESLGMTLWSLRMDRAYQQSRSTFRELLRNKVPESDGEIRRVRMDKVATGDQATEVDTPVVYPCGDTLFCSRRDYERYCKSPMSFYEAQVKYHNMCQNALRNYDCFW